MLRVGLTVDLSDVFLNVERSLMHPLIKSCIVIAQYLALQNAAQLSGVQCFERIKLGRALAMSFLEAGLAPLGILDRRPWQAILPALLKGERDRPHLDVEVEALEAQAMLDLACDGNRHGTARPDRSRRCRGCGRVARIAPRARPD